MRIAFITLFIACVSALQINAQIETPRPSPMSTVSQKVGLGEFTVTYSRPSMKGRKVFGEMVSYDKLWRFGANMATTFKSTDDFSIEGKNVPAGEYSLFAIPGEKEWTMILNKVAKLSGTYKYAETEDVLRWKVKSIALSTPVETFTIQFANLRDNAATVQVAWENTLVTFDVMVAYDERVMKQIDEVMAGPSSGAYYTAASYYFNNKKDFSKALTWVNKSLESAERYWVLTLKAQIQAGLEDYKGAIETANRAIALATADEDDAYVKANSERVAEWTPKVQTKKKK
jgi:tetratricopeptide (TPR) repeat protein